MLIRWGTEKADQLQLESVIGATPFAREAYEKCGFGCVEVINVDLNVSNPSEKWKQYQGEDLHGYMMWRPAGNDFVPGKDIVPWNDP
jgi:hypothetical protein